MNIKSSYKDYYDHLQYTYGIDEKLILVRKTLIRGEAKPYNIRNDNYGSGPNNGQEYVFHIMGRVFWLYYMNGKFITYDWLVNNEKKLEEINVKLTVYPYTKKDVILVDDPKNKSKQWNRHKVFVSKYNELLNIPILLQNGNNHKQEDIKDWIAYPELKQFNFGGIISPEDMWINLYNWLSRVKEEPAEMSNKEKIVSHGFDLKTSFRNM